MTRTRLFAALIAVCATFAAGGAVTGQVMDLQPIQLRVVWTADPAHEATISWSTGIAGSTHVVHYDIAPRGAVLADYAFTSELVTTGEYEAGGPFFHHASMTDLPANTDVFFTVETDGLVSEELHFRTAPDGDDTIKFLYGGDSRTGRTDRQHMNRLMATLHEDDPEIVALVHGGDYIAYANSWPQWTAWLDDHELTISASGRVLPIVPAKGNHEGRGVLYNRVFGDPSGDPERNWFVTRFGQLALINLDTEASLAGEQRDWLAARLAEGRDARWLLVNYHRPAFPAVKSPSGAREHWVPLFEQFDVDMVCESDGHALKRTPPIRNEVVDFTGVTYVGEGGLGVPRRTPLTDLWYLQAPGMAARAHHVQKIVLTPDLLRYQALLMDGTVADEITVLPRAERLDHRITPVHATAPTRNHVEIQLSLPFDAVSAIEGDWQIEPAVAVKRVEIGAQVPAVLALANTATTAELDDTVGLDARAAKNIVAFRAGDDEIADTDDDRVFETWGELDAISYVGESALRRMTEYALNGVANERNIITLEVGDLEPGQMYRVRVPEVADLAGRTVAAGTTFPVTFNIVDDRADAIAKDANVEADAGGCSTVEGGRARPLWFIALIGFWGARRRLRRA